MLRFDSEAGLVRAAAGAAQRWHDARLAPLLIGLKGDLGVGKTVWVRAVLESLGHVGRVPSPTYTLLEHYVLEDLTIVHLDLYRLAEPRELEFLGLRDWLAQPKVWVLVEWPERSPLLSASLDLVLELSIVAGEARELVPTARSATGEQALSLWLGPGFK
jgi:tRNA threonylcarbamoyladenosine biosynthesis protein TsaE